jgi:hypothetical protein
VNSRRGKHGEADPGHDARRPSENRADDSYAERGAVEGDRPEQ